MRNPIRVWARGWPEMAATAGEVVPGVLETGVGIAAIALAAAWPMVLLPAAHAVAGWPASMGAATDVGLLVTLAWWFVGVVPYAAGLDAMEGDDGE